MHLGWLALPGVLAMVACAPVRTYQKAAQSLRFSLDRVQPGLELAFPLDRSRLSFQITLGVENPSKVPFHLQSFQGELRLASGDATPPVGQVTLVRPVELPAAGRTELTVEIAFRYQDLRDQWPALAATLGPDAAGAWSLDGQLKLEAYGIAWQVPVKTRRTFGGAP